MQNFLASVESGKVNQETLSYNHLLKIVSENCANTTFHSINYIYHTKDWFLKLVLLVCFLASTAFCGYLIVKTFVSFISFGVLTSTSINSAIPTECMKKKNVWVL
jgi:hypothetical protein